jgi:hypothetical protein
MRYLSILRWIAFWWLVVFTVLVLGLDALFYALDGETGVHVEAQVGAFGVTILLAVVFHTRRNSRARTIQEPSAQTSSVEARGLRPKTTVSAPANRPEVSLERLRREARRDPRSREIVAALDNLDRSGPLLSTHRIDDWCFADGEYCVLFRRGGLSYIASTTRWRRVRPSATVTFQVTSSGSIPHASIDTLEFTNLRPQSNARKLLESIGGIASSISAPPVADLATEKSSVSGGHTSTQRLASSEADVLVEPTTSAGRYSTLEWTTSQVRDVRSALVERGIEFRVQRGWLIVDPEDQPFVDRIIGEHISSFCNAPA